MTTLSSASATTPPARSKTNPATEFMRAAGRTITPIILLGIISVICTLAFPYLIGRLVDAVQTGEGVVRSAALIVAAGLGGAITMSVATYLVGRAGETAVLALRRRTIAHSLDLRVADVRRTGAGDLATRLGPDALQIKAAIDILPLQIPTAVITVVGTLIIMALLDVVLLGVTVACFLVAILVVGALMVLLRRRYAELQNGVASLGDAFVRDLQSVTVIKAFGAQDKVFRRLSESAERLAGIGRSVAGVESFVVPAMTLGQQIALVGVLIGGSSRVVTGDLSLAAFIAYILYLLQLVSPVVMAVAGLASVQSGFVAGQRFDELFDAPREGAFIGDSRPDKQSTGIRADTACPEPVSAVRFEEVAFSYGDRPVLSAASFEVPRRGVTALIGRSGAGKSTIFGLIERFEHPETGRIEVLGRDIAQVPVDTLRADIAYIDQEFTLLPGSVRDNLSLGASGPVEDESLWAVLQEVDLAGAISALPDGLDTELGREHDLSGGQRQRLATARVLLSEAPLVLMDEPSSQLDRDSEQLLHESIARIAQERTVLLIAHRRSTIECADRILVVDDAQVRPFTGAVQPLLQESLPEELAGARAELTAADNGAVI